MNDFKSRVVICCLIFFASSGKFYSQVWINPTPNTSTSYVYAPGLFMSESLMGRYCPKFVASTGEVITCCKGIEVIRAPARACNFTEISLKRTKKSNKPVHKGYQNAYNNQTKKQMFVNALLTFFCMVWYTGSYLSNIFLGFTIEMPKGKKAEESLSMYSVDLTKVNLAQEKDLAIFKQTYNNLVALNKEDSCKKSIVLYGTSRGSATVFNFAALEHPEHVSAIICEGLFDSLEHLTARCSPWVNFLSSILPKVGQFDHQGIVPIKLIERMPKHIPILLITSRKDTTVPCECTINMYNQLRATGHSNTHILILEKSSHNFYPYGIKKECELYENVVHAFYKKYGLPYIAEYANKGEEYFMVMTQPVVCF